MKFTSKNPSFEYLKSRWTQRHETAKDNFWNAHSQALKQLAIGSLGSLMLISAPISQSALLPNPTAVVSRDDALKNYDQNVLMAARLQEIIPAEVRPLTMSEEEKITQILSEDLGLKVTAQLNNVRLNKNFGIIGGEQHLYRYPGDNLYAHFDNAADWAMYGSAGIAPGLGAWGYFAPSKKEFSEIDKQREKYYLAIQTFLVPGYAENPTLFRDFFKFRKMLVVNPQTGQAVVAVIADAGPSPWTGKDLGGSPKVMNLIGLAEGPRKGPVLYFFIDDPNDEISLGPIKVRSASSHPERSFSADQRVEGSIL